MNSEQINKTEYYLFLFCIIDAIFLPYMRIVTVTYSFVIAFFLFFKFYGQIKQENTDLKNFWIMVFFMFGSMIVGITMDINSGKDNFVYFLQYTVTFMYFYCYRHFLNKYRFCIKKILFAFIIFATVVAVVYFFNIGLYYDIRMIWSNRASTALYLRDYTAGSTMRYGFVWMDENNIGYIMNAVLVYLLCNEKTNIIEKIILIGCTLFVLVCTMSNGGLISFTVGMGCVLIVKLFSAKGVIKIRTTTFIFSTVMLIIIGILAYKYIPEFLQSKIAVASNARVSENSAESRLRIWTYILQNVNFFDYSLFGHGVRTLVNGAAVKPHNVHFYYILVYGIIAYIEMMYITFRKRRVTKWGEWIWIIPFLLGATANVIIGELKAMCVITLLLAASTSHRYLSDRREEKENE